MSATRVNTNSKCRIWLYLRVFSICNHCTICHLADKGIAFLQTPPSPFHHLPHDLKLSKQHQNFGMLQSIRLLSERDTVRHSCTFVKIFAYSILWLHFDVHKPILTIFGRMLPREQALKLSFTFPLHLSNASALPWKTRKQKNSKLNLFTQML